MFRSFTAAVTAGLATLALAPVAEAAPLATWHGRYVWEESLGRIGGDTPADGLAAFVTTTLVLGPSAGPTQCRINAEGYQTYKQMQCTATPEMNALVIKFYKFNADSTGRYTLGTPLFRMTRTPGGLVTRLQAMQPSSDATPRSGRLFRRVG